MATAPNRQQQQKIGVVEFDKDLAACLVPFELPFGAVSRIQDRDLQQLLHTQVQLAHGVPRLQADRFAGAQPVSLMRRDVATVLENDYWTAEKTDGGRYLLCLFVLHVTLRDTTFRTGGGDSADEEDGAGDGLPKKKRRKKKGTQEAEQQQQQQQQSLGARQDTTSLKATYRIVCLQDRSCQFYVLNHIEAPAFLFPSIQDGEIWRNDAGVWEMVLFDTVQNSGYTIARQFAFEHRIAIYTEFAAQLRYRDAASASVAMFRVRGKVQYRKRRMRHVVDQIIRKQRDPEGGILTPNECAVQTGTNARCFKVKLAGKHTFDLKLVPDTTLTALEQPGGREADRSIQLRVLGVARVEVDEAGRPVRETLADVKSEYVQATQGLRATFGAEPIPVGWEGRIFECTWDADARQYRVCDKGLREKHHPNNAVTVYRTHRNIDEGLTLEELADAIEASEAARCDGMDLGQRSDAMVATAEREAEQRHRGYLQKLLVQSNWNVGPLPAAEFVRNAQKPFEPLWQRQRRQQLAATTRPDTDAILVAAMARTLPLDAFPAWKSSALKDARKLNREEEVRADDDDDKDGDGSTTTANRKRRRRATPGNSKRKRSTTLSSSSSSMSIQEATCAVIPTRPTRVPTPPSSTTKNTTTATTLSDTEETIEHDQFEDLEEQEQDSEEYDDGEDGAEDEESDQGSLASYGEEETSHVPASIRIRPRDTRQSLVSTGSLDDDERDDSEAIEVAGEDDSVEEEEDESESIDVDTERSDEDAEEDEDDQEEGAEQDLAEDDNHNDDNDEDDEDDDDEVHAVAAEKL